MKHAQRPPWLSRDLLLRLMLPLLAIVSATAALGAYTAHRLNDRVFDRWLLDAALSVGSLVHLDHGQASLDLPAQAEAVLLYDDVDRTYFSVSQGDRLLAGRRGIPSHGAHTVQYQRASAFEGQFDGKRVRIGRIDVEAAAGPPVTILVAETLQKRQHAEQELIAVLWPMAALVLAAAAAIMIAVRRTVAPLELIAARWSERSHESLSPIGNDDVPRELLAFASALNALLARIRAMLARERHFAATAAHQLRTPLAGLQLGLARLSDAPDVATIQQIASELTSTTQRTARLVQQLLALGRLDPEARRDADFVETNLVDLAQDVGAAHADQALAKRIELELIAPAAPVRIIMQSDLMAEALSNLIDNAIRYTPSGGHVLIEVLEQPALIRISDSGPGIPESEREAVFERFVRGRGAVGDGSGLGLAIVRDIAALHEAKVTLADSVWGGLTVTMVFSCGRPNTPA